MKEQLSLKNDGIEMIDYPNETRIHVEAAAQAWKRFIQLPDNEKQLFAAKALQSDVGYERKGNGERESKDIKENFDLTSASLSSLENRITENEVAKSFIHSSGKLFHSLRDMIHTYGEHVEKTYDVDGFAQEAAASAGSAFVRFLYYPPTPVGTLIGEPHVDHSGFTFHLFESTDGCDRLALDSDRWLPMPVEEGKAAAFCSMQSQLFSHNELHGLCHRIISNEVTATVGRIAIVCFVPLVNTPTYDRATHGRLQEMKPGFNYHMNAAEFSQLFA